MKQAVAFIWFSIGVAHAQLMGNFYNDHHRHKLLTDTSATPPIVGQANYFIPTANEVGGKMISSDWTYFQPVLVSYTEHSRDLHFDDVLPGAPVANLLVEPFKVQGDVAKAEAATAAKATHVAHHVRTKRKNILRYRNGDLRPMLCSLRLCLSVMARPP